MKRARAKLSITMENFKIFQLQEELELPKFPLKSEKRNFLLNKTDHNFVKNAWF
jgi:hypothetical protein